MVTETKVVLLLNASVPISSKVEGMVKLAELLSNQSTIRHLAVALYYNRAGMHDDALSWLEKGFANHDVNMPYAFLPAELNNLRSDPRYAALAVKMNLPF